MSEECPSVICVPPDDLRQYGTQGFAPLPPQPIEPQPCNFKNQAVYFNGVCDSGKVPSFSGSLPSWATFDPDNNRIIANAGSFCGATQIGANNNAQTVLSNFVIANMNNGNLTCALPNVVIVMKDDEVGNVLPTHCAGIRKLGSNLFVGRTDNQSILKIFESSDGLAWSAITVDTIVGTNSIGDVAFGNGVYVAVTRNNNNTNSTNKGTSYVSADLSTWSKNPIGAAADAFNGSYSSVAFGAGLFVAVSVDGNRARSADGITWITAAGSGNVYANVSFINGVFIATDSAGNAEKSADGITWSSNSTGGATAVGSAYGAGLYVVTCSFFGFSTSPDGVTWTHHATPALSRVSFGSGKFTAVFSTTIYQSDDGVTWAAIAKVANHSTFGVEYFTGGKFVVIENY